jgi:GT2 family glycosyltransferase
MAQNVADIAGDSTRVSEQSPGALSWRIPPLIKRLLPGVVASGLRQLKGRIATRGFSRRIEFEYSPEDIRASASMSIIVPIHDAPNVTRRCLASLEKYAPEAEIILVDDASQLAETRKLIDLFSNRDKWNVTRHKNPLGHSAACETGGRLATRPYLCLLNSDTIVTPWCWRRIKEVFESDPAIGVAGPSTSNSGTRQTLPLAAKFCAYWNNNQICNFANRLITERADQVAVDLAWVSGFAFFIRRTVWEQLGGFNRNLPDYGNEVELCKRVAESGYRMVWVPSSYIHHFGRQSYGDKVEWLFDAWG